MSQKKQLPTPKYGQFRDFKTGVSKLFLKGTDNKYFRRVSQLFGFATVVQKWS